MKKITFLFIFVTFFIMGQIKIDSVFALPGDDSQEFFQEGDEQMDQEIENLEEKQSDQQIREQKEKKLEQELEIRQEGPRIEEVPSPEQRLGIDDNKPFPSGHEEIRID